MFCNHNALQSGTFLWGTNTDSLIRTFNPLLQNTGLQKFNSVVYGYISIEGTKTSLIRTYLINPLDSRSENLETSLMMYHHCE